MHKRTNIIIHFLCCYTFWKADYAMSDSSLSLYTNAALNLKDTYYGSNVTLSAFFQDSNEKTAKMDIYLPFSTDFCMAF